MYSFTALKSDYFAEMLLSVQMLKFLLLKRFLLNLSKLVERGTELSCYFSKGFTYSKKDLLFFKE